MVAQGINFKKFLNNENLYTGQLYPVYFFALMQKSNKKNQGKNIAPHFFLANAQRLRKIETCLLSRSDNGKLCLVLSGYTGGTTFSLALLIEESVL